MSRSGYDIDGDFDNWSMIRWAGAVASAIKGKRGQAFLKEMLSALDTLPEKKLIAEELELDGQVCALGAVGKVRGIDMANIDSHDYDKVASIFGIPQSLAREIMFANDGDGYCNDTPEVRYSRVRRTIEFWIKKIPA